MTMIKIYISILDQLFFPWITKNHGPQKKASFRISVGFFFGVRWTQLSSAPPGEEIPKMAGRIVETINHGDEPSIWQ